jgi:hypothetical protein
MTYWLTLFLRIRRGCPQVQISAQRMVVLIECSHGYTLSRQANIGIVH